MKRRDLLRIFVGETDSIREKLFEQIVNGARELNLAGLHVTS